MVKFGFTPFAGAMLVKLNVKLDSVGRHQLRHWFNQEVPACLFTVTKHRGNVTRIEGIFSKQVFYDIPTIFTEFREELMIIKTDYQIRKLQEENNMRKGIVPAVLEDDGLPF